MKTVLWVKCLSLILFGCIAIGYSIYTHSVNNPMMHIAEEVLERETGIDIEKAMQLDASSTVTPQIHCP